MNRRAFLAGVAGLGLVGSELLMGSDEKTKTMNGRVLIEAGRRVDAPDTQAARFPSANVDQVRQRVREVLTKEKTLAVVCSAACGADLIVLDIAGSLSIDRYILLPSEPAEFRKTSVVDRPGDWGDLYDQVLKASKVEVLKVPEGQEGYLETNLKLLDRGQELARKHSSSAEALVVWNKELRGSDDVTGHFLAQAKRRQLPVIEISTM